MSLTFPDRERQPIINFLTTSGPEPQVAISPRRAHRWSGWFEIVCNVIGTFGFAVGSMFWCLSFSATGAIIFAASCVFCGISCSVYAHKFRRTEDYVGVYALVQQAVGCFVFVICSFLFLVDDYAMIANLGFMTASLLFLTGCLLSQVQMRSATGILASVIPCLPRPLVLPTAFFNTFGSVLFVVGSVLICYQDLTIAGAWLYEVGSIFFFLASWGDFSVWWSMGITQSEHPTATAEVTPEDEYMAVKFL